MYFQTEVQTIFTSLPILNMMNEPSSQTYSDWTNYVELAVKSQHLRLYVRIRS